MAPPTVIPYSPRRIFLPFHARSQRFAVGVAHRRCGKTVSTINDKIRRAVCSEKENYRAAYIAPYLKQAKDVAWEYLKRYARPVLVKPPNESELWVEVLSASGAPARIRLYGADNAEALRGGYLDDATLDEYGDQAPSVWGEIIRPMLADRRGTATFIGTPKGKNHFHAIYRYAIDHPDEWFSFLLPASRTGILEARELDAARRDMTPEQYAQEFECSFDAAILGAYYGRDIAETERAGRICDVPYEPSLPVYTAWDLGIGDSTAIWMFQCAGNELRFVDYYENHGQSLAHYAAELASRGVKAEKDFVPHDARVRELGTGRSRLETLVGLNLHPELVPAHKIMDGINAARVSFPNIWFDAGRCADGIEALRQYRTEYDEKTRAYKDTPKHDWTSHCFTGDTLILTRHGMREISNLPLFGEILTPCGWKQYRNPRITRRNARLVEVTFAGGFTVRCTPDHLFLTESGWKSAERLVKGSTIRSSLTLSRSISMAASTAFGRVKRIFRGAVKSCIERFGELLSGISLKAATSTTEMATQPIIQLRTLSAWKARSTFRTRSESHQDSLQMPSGQPLLRGTDQRLEGFGTVVMQSGPRVGRSGSGKTSRASIAGMSLTLSSARAAIRNAFALLTAKPLRIESVVDLSEAEDVWCLTVPDGEMFSLGNGAVVHNCADAFRYACMAWREQIAPKAPPEARPIRTIREYTLDEAWKLIPKQRRMRV